MSKGLTSFRAVAFLAVFLFHTIGPKAGYLGVQAFFVLSGFLITPILLDMKTNLSKTKFFVHFYGRRALRIFPLYYLYLLLIAAISLIIIFCGGYTGITEIDRFLEQLPWALTYTYNFFNASESYQHIHLLTHFWSLAVEEQFYLIWPFLLFFIPLKHLKKSLIIIFLSGPILRFFISIITVNNLMPNINDDMNLVVYVLPFSHLDAFSIGGYFALYKRSKSKALMWLVLISVIVFGFITEFMFSTSNISLSSFGYAPLMGDSFKVGSKNSFFLFRFKKITEPIKRFS